MVAKLSKIFIFLICFFLFYSYISSAMILLLAMGMLGVFMLFKNKLFKIKRTRIYAYLSGVLVLVSAIWAEDVLDAFTFCVVIVGFSFLGNIVLDRPIEYKKYIIKIMYVLSSVHVIATIVARFFPDIMLYINQKLLQPSAYIVVRRLYNQKTYSGIAPQTGTDAYFIMVFLIISLFIFINKKNIWTLGLNFIGVYALLVTSKRASLLIYGLILLVCLLYYLTIKHKGTNKIIIKIIVASLIIILFLYVINAFGYLFVEGDVEGISSGRWGLYTTMLDMYLKKPVLGYGFGHILKVFGMHGHNIYLQLLCEYGLLSCVFFVWFFQSLIQTYRLFKKSTGERALLNGISLCFQIYFIVYGVFGNPVFDYFQLGLYMLFSFLICKESENENGKKNRNIDIS